MRTTLAVIFVSLFVLWAIWMFLLYPLYKRIKEKKKTENLEKRLSKAKEAFRNLGLEHRDILKYYFDEGLSSNWGLINRQEIECLNLKMKHLEEDIDIKSKWLDLKSIETIEWAITQTKAKINLLKVGIKI